MISIVILEMVKKQKTKKHQGGGETSAGNKTVNSEGIVDYGISILWNSMQQLKICLYILIYSKLY